MTVNQVFLRASLASWRRVAAHRFSAWKAAHGVARPVAHRKWNESVAMVRKRAGQLSSLTEAHGSSASCARFVAEFEGGASKDGMFRPYQDSVGVWTIGYGHTEGVSRGSRPLTVQEATSLLSHDLNVKYAPAVDRAARRARVKLNQNRFDALTSFVYNLGIGILDPSHTIGAALRKRNMKTVAEAFLLYDKAGGHALPGLTRRRRAEHDLFNKRPRPN